MFKFPFGTQELQGVAARGNYDLTQHGLASGKSMEYFDEARKEKYVPHVIEPSIGVDRLMLAVLCSAYAEDEIGGEKRSVLRFHPRLAPIKAAVLPLVKNKVCGGYMEPHQRGAWGPHPHLHRTPTLPLYGTARADREGQGHLHAAAAALLRHL